MKKITFYHTASGSCPVEEFLDSLTSKQAQKVAWVMQLVEDLEHVPSQYFTKLLSTEDLWEIRVQTGGSIFRLLGFLESPAELILCHGFKKKTQKTPSREIAVAQRRRLEYLKRERENYE